MKLTDTFYYNYFLLTSHPHNNNCEQKLQKSQNFMYYTSYYLLTQLLPGDANFSTIHPSYIKFLSKHNIWFKFETSLYPLQLKNIFKLNTKHSLPTCSPKSLTIYYTIMPNTKPLACTMLRDVTMFALQLTAVMLCPTSILQKTQNLDCIYILALSWTHYPQGICLTWTIMKTIVYKIQFLYSPHLSNHFHRTASCLNQKEYYNTAAICYHSVRLTRRFGSSNTSACQQTWAIC